MKSKILTICNKLGMHARASALLSDTANKFQCEIYMSYNNQKTDAKSILGVMTMGATLGCEVEVTTDGIDEDLALQTISDLFNNRFGENE